MAHPTFITWKKVEPGSIILRSLAGLSEGTGRTVVIVGPPGSGKSRVLASLRGRLEQQGCRVLELAGAYRDRGVPQSTAARILDEYLRIRSEEPGPGGSVAPAEGALPWGVPPLATSVVPSRQRLQLVGRRSTEVRPEDLWDRFEEESRQSGFRPLAILVDDAGLLDDESRSFLLALSQRARLRPLLVGIVLDESQPGYGPWDAELRKRTDVDRIRRPHTTLDPRDVQRLQADMRALPPSALELARYTALLGGNASQIALGRVGRGGHAQVVEGLQLLTRSNLLRLRGDRVRFATEGAFEVVADAIPEPERRAMHGRIADTLEAMHPEPTLDDRIQIAEHRYGHAKDAAALAALQEAARLLERQFRFDEAEGFLTEAIACAASLDSDDRLALEAALRVERSRLLVFAGRPEEAERQLRDSLGMAVLAKLSAERLEELVRGILPALWVVGARPTLATDLGEFADRLHTLDALGAEALVIAALAEFDLQRGHVDQARVESTRISRIARGLPPGPLQALALVTVAAALNEGSEDERRIGGKCLRSAQVILTRHRDLVVQLYGDLIQTRRLIARGEREVALSVHDQAVQVAQRAHLPPLELLHEVGVAGLLLDERPDPRLGRALGRARELANLLHLVPPSGPLLGLQMLEGRYAARADRLGTARQMWSSVAEIRATSVPVSYRAEAWLRLADLELSQQRPSEAQAYLQQLERPETLRGLPVEWASWFADLRGRADREETPGLEPVRSIG